MAKKSTNAGAKNCTCDKCQATAHAIGSSTHRRCSGQPDQPIRAKHDLIAGNLRGHWN